MLYLSRCICKTHGSSYEVVALNLCKFIHCRYDLLLSTSSQKLYMNVPKDILQSFLSSEFDTEEIQDVINAFVVTT